MLWVCKKVVSEHSVCELVECQASIQVPIRELTQWFEKIMGTLNGYLGLKVYAYIIGTDTCEDQRTLSSRIYVVDGIIEFPELLNNGMQYERVV